MNDELPKAPVSDNDVDPAKIIPLEAARAHLRHWWREPLAGLVAVGIGVFDSWHFGREGGLTGSLDEILVVGGIVLLAGSRRLFSPSPTEPTTLAGPQKQQ
jgi:hypothetical protein